MLTPDLPLGSLVPEGAQFALKMYMGRDEQRIAFYVTNYETANEAARKPTRDIATVAMDYPRNGSSELKIASIHYGVSYSSSGPCHSNGELRSSWNSL